MYPIPKSISKNPFNLFEFCVIREFLNKVFIIGDFGSGSEYMLAQLELIYNRVALRLISSLLRALLGR